MAQEVFHPNFRPVALPGEHVKLLPEGRDDAGNLAYRVAYVEPIMPIPIDFQGSSFNNGNLSTGSETAAFELKDLEVGRRFLGQYRVIPDDFIQLDWFQPRAVSRYTTLRTSPRTSIARPNMEGSTDLYVWGENRNPYVKIRNLSPDTLTRMQVYFIGWKMHFEPDRVQEPKQFTAIPIQGLQPSDTGV